MIPPSTSSIATVVDPEDEDGELVLADHHREWRHSRAAIEKALDAGVLTTDPPAREISLGEGLFNIPRDDPVLDTRAIIATMLCSEWWLPVEDCPMTDLSLRTAGAIERGILRFDPATFAEHGPAGCPQVGTVTIDDGGAVVSEWFDAP